MQRNCSVQELELSVNSFRDSVMYYFSDKKQEIFVLYAKCKGVLLFGFVVTLSKHLVAKVMGHIHCECKLL